MLEQLWAEWVEVARAVSSSRLLVKLSIPSGGKTSTNYLASAIQRAGDHPQVHRGNTEGAGATERVQCMAERTHRVVHRV